VPDQTHATTLLAGSWNAHSSPPQSGDEVWGWLEQGFGLSSTNDYAAGQTVVMHHVGQSDNGDAGFCLCSVHNGLEIGGGLLHGGVSLPVPPGKMSIEARRRLARAGDDDDIDLRGRIGSGTRPRERHRGRRWLGGQDGAAQCRSYHLRPVRKELERKAFTQASAYQPLRLVADLLGRKGHTMEARVYWHGTSTVKIDKLVVETF
jgi:hypothetical protein